MLFVSRFRFSPARWGLALLLLALLVGGAALLRAQTAPQDSFSALYIVGSDTVGVERVRATATSYTGDLRLKGQPRVVWTQQLREAPGTRTLHISAWQPGASESDAPFQALTLQIRGDSAYVYSTPAAGAPLGAPQTVIAARAGAVWMVNQSLSHGAWVAQHAAVRDTAWVMLASGARLFPGVVANSGGNIAFTIAGARSEYAMSSEGLLQGAMMPSQQLTVRVARGSAGTALEDPAARKVSYDAPANAPYIASAVRITTTMGHTLAGTLTTPSNAIGRLPAVITITGSGGQERDEAIAGVEGYRLFRQVADTLGRRGIAVLRLDDRGIGESTGSFATATSRDFADDVRAAIKWLRLRSDIDPSRIALVGHSEGGLIAPMVAVDDPALAGIVLLAGPAYTGKRIIAFQQRSAIEQAYPTSVAAERDSLFRVSQEALDSTALVNPWIREFLRYDPIPTARRVKVPVLVLQGDTDMQVTPEQADTLAAAFRRYGSTQIRVHRLANTNHLFQRDPAGLPSGYGALPVRQATAEAMGLLADWLATTLRSEQSRP